MNEEGIGITPKQFRNLVLMRIPKGETRTVHKVNIWSMRQEVKRMKIIAPKKSFRLIKLEEGVMVVRTT